VPRDQCKSKEVDAEARPGHAEPNKDSAEARGTASSTERAVGVT